MAGSDEKNVGGILLGALAVGLLAFLLRIALFRVAGDPIDWLEASLVAVAVVVTVLVLQWRKAKEP